MDGLKYAGNWGEQYAPWSFRFQRWFLLNYQHRKVTINGRWSNQANHCISFENPCITGQELETAKVLGINKTFDHKFTLAFVGSLSPKKGIIELLEAISLLKNKHCIEKIIIAGDGIIRVEVEALARRIGVPVALLGFVNRNQLNAVYAQSHFICLPSHSEGFPKVIAEGAAFGCVPIVSDVSAIGQYIVHNENGFLLKQVDTLTIADLIDEVVGYGIALKQVSEKAIILAHLFTYERFKTRIIKEILN
ncbi:MAG: glycosyltransferase family 4 protein [Saprospiraceae bacterium]|nr:glycosyltransferase family 4 protein [Saprospiraceae bacterium]